MLFSTLSHMITLIHSAQYLVKGIYVVLLEEPYCKGVVMLHEEQDQVLLKELLVLRDEHINKDENKELGEELLDQSEDAGIPIQVGKTILFMK